MKAINKFLAITCLAALSACQSAYPGFYRPIPPLASPGFQIFNAPQVHGDVAVKFNNAYHERYEDNEQTGRLDPQNPDKLFVKLMTEAQKTLDIAVFSLTEPSAIEALMAASQRGVRVRVIIDSDYMYQPNGHYLLPHIKALREAGVQIKGDRRSGLMHHKFVIMDSLHVVTGSANLTPHSLYRDNNNSLKITSPELAANYQAEFNRMFNQNLFGPNPHTIPHPVVNVDGATIQTFFSPKGGTKQAILETLGKAQNNIRFMTFSVTDSDIQKMLVDKARQGVQVQGIFDGCMLSQYSIYQDLLTKNIPVLIDGNQALLHSKVFIVDNKVVITGSYNFSKSAEERNNENTLIIRSPKVTSFYNAEFERLEKAAQINKPPPYDNRACNSPLIDDGDINPH